MAYNRRDDDLAYGDYHGQDRAQGQEGGEGERGFIGDVGRKFFGGSKPQGEQSQSPSFIFDKLHKAVHEIGSDIKDKVSGKQNTQQQNLPQQSSQPGQQPQTQGPSPEFHSEHRFSSFAPTRQGNDIKWYVDGCSYFWALSVALERARESIWILDWWLSPELYLRRPPAKFQQYRIDRMLEAAAKRGVKVNIIVYKEVTQALTLSSSHTKHALEALHPNIAVFRHPDHLPDTKVLQSNFITSLQNMSFSPAKLAQLPGDSLKAIYGAHDGTVLYWAHHEKLCLIDGHIAFMGGLDACYGRWDTNQHAIADAHPGDLDRIVFPGQDYNNARIMDFHDVVNWEKNNLDRTVSSRMGWTDVSVSLVGPVVQDLRTHFTQRWNFIYDEKYSKKASHYTRLPETHSGAQYPPSTQQREFDGEEGERGLGGNDGDDQSGDRGLFGRSGGLRHKLFSRVSEGFHGAEQQFGQHDNPPQQQSHAEHGAQAGGIECQITRSASKWSHNVTTEHSIQNAYCEIIRDSKHFVYIEQQFFITATSDLQKPIKNKIGAAIVERILRAARNGEKYKMIVMIPAVPAFAGDLKGDDALGTRAIMEFQYDSINRGGNSIYETIAKAGFNPMDYIRFYNLRSYDRINASGAMRAAEERSGVQYQQASNERDAAYEASRGEYQAYRPPPTAEYGVYEMDGTPSQPSGGRPYGDDSGYGGASYTSNQPSAPEKYQQGAAQIGSLQGLGSGRWDTVSECYMLGGEDIRNVPWEGGAMSEIDAFVSEELYIHSKILIADDRIVICGSANLNDRSQCGDHDSEIAIIIHDPTPIDSTMDGRPYTASRFAASLRRQIFRKHLGLLRPQIIDAPDANFEPIGVANAYDFGSEEDWLVADPLSDDFLSHWNWRAKLNTDAFARVFHPVPSDSVRTWKEYDEYYSRFFAEVAGDKEKEKRPSLYKWGHVVAENFAPGEEGVREVKEELAKIRGTLVEMPLLFLKGEDIAKEGLGLNAFTEEVYT